MDGLCARAGAQSVSTAPSSCTIDRSPNRLARTFSQTAA
jgi:hypothetical protein